MKRLSIFISLSAILLGACSEQTSTSVEDSATKDVEAKALAEKQESEAELAEQERIAEEARQNSLTAIQDYYDDAQPVMEHYSELMEIFNEQVVAATADPSLNASEDWIFNTDSILYEMGWVIDDLKEIQAPPELQESNKYLVMALDEAKFFSENYIPAVRNFNFSLLEECQVAMGMSQEYLKQSSVISDQERTAIFGAGE